MLCWSKRWTNGPLSRGTLGCVATKPLLKRSTYYRSTTDQCCCASSLNPPADHVGKTLAWQGKTISTMRTNDKEGKSFPSVLTGLDGEVTAAPELLETQKGGDTRRSKGENGEYQNVQHRSRKKAAGRLRIHIHISTTRVTVPNTMWWRRAIFDMQLQYLGVCVLLGGGVDRLAWLAAQEKARVHPVLLVGGALAGPRGRVEFIVAFVPAMVSSVCWCRVCV